MGYKGQTDKRIGRIAATQSGVFSFGQAIGKGVSKGVIGDRVASQGLFRVYRGTYSLTRRVSQKGIWWAGVLSAGEGSALSHMSALRLWGITTWVGPTEVIRTGSYGKKSGWDGRYAERSAVTETGRPIPVLRVRSTRSIHRSEVTTYQGIPVTTVARSFVDVCGSIGKGQLKKLLHEAAREGLLDFAGIRTAMDRARGKKGVGKLREIIDDWDPQTA